MMLMKLVRIKSVSSDYVFCCQSANIRLTFLCNLSTCSNSLPNGNDKIKVKKQGLLPPPVPYLDNDQISEIANCAAKRVESLPLFEAKPLKTKKKINKQINDIIALPKDFSEERLEQIRKYAAIYRRFDSKRLYSKPVSKYEVYVNEASAQLCFLRPTLLTRRAELLLPLAREVVKDSGYQYSKGHSRATNINPENPSKRQKLKALIPECKGNQTVEKAKRGTKTFVYVVELIILNL
ncbi:NAB transcription cofactor mab-10-like [Mercenaria mercenaria]|uniref:NAB transcription cofactor mab-10-like n=1 Tax=Mercenaria mercenaria TaxID=6596 RepID=UPI00234E6DAA|nr:NAB transcription cofactor mab-10-like [Mercenaria mercenaria]